MASTKRYYNKKGELVSIQIRVYRGEDENGKTLKPYQKSVKVPKGSTERQVQKLIQEQSVLFERECREGLASDDGVLFRDFAREVMELKRVEGIELSTLDRYQDILDNRLIPYFGQKCATFPARCSTASTVRCCNPAKTRKQAARSHGKPCWSSTVCSPPSSRKQKSCTSSRGIPPRMLRRQKPPKPRRPTTSPPSLQKSKLPLMRNPPSGGRSATCAWSTVTAAASLRASSAPASTSQRTVSYCSARCCTIPGAALMRSLTQRTKKAAYSRCLPKSKPC